MHDNDFYGDKFKWFTGVVKEKDDAGRVRVRVYGIHRMEDTTDVSDEDLPWATVLLPATSGETSSTNSSIALDTGDWVVGFYADGDNCQQPIVLGALGQGKDSDNYSPTGGDTAFDGGDDSGGGSDIPDGGGDDGSGNGTGTQLNDTAVPGNSVEAKVYVLLKTELLRRLGGNEEKSHQIACAIMGNINQESSFNLNAQNVGEAAFGLIQWRHDDRRSLLFRRTFGDNMLPVVVNALNNDRPLPGGTRVTGVPIPGAADQVSFIFYELDKAPHHKAWTAMMATGNVRDAAYQFGRYFVLPAVVERSRSNYAETYYNRYRNYRVAPAREL